MGVPGDEKENIKHIKGRIAEFSPSLQKNTNLYTQKAQKNSKEDKPKDIHYKYSGRRFWVQTTVEHI
jgi:hypothetical protein